MSIKTEKLTFFYSEGSPFETKALDNIDIEVKKGDFVGIIGHTGSGKSTLIQHFNGLIIPEKGNVYVDNISLKDKKNKIKDVRKIVGLVFQYPEYQLFEETVFKDVSYGPLNLGLSGEEIDKRVKHAIELVGLNFNEVKDKSPFDLSGGQKRRVAIAGVLAMEPEYLILDEPTAGLDPIGRNEILRQIKEMHDKNNITVVLVSHNMEDIARLAKYIYVLYEGRIKMQGTPKEIYSNAEELHAIGLDIPQVIKIMMELKKKGFQVRTDVLSIEEAKIEILKVLRSK